MKRATNGFLSIPCHKGDVRNACEEQNPYLSMKWLVFNNEISGSIYASDTDVRDI